MSTLGIVTFIEARLTEDEATAHEATPGPWWLSTYIDYEGRCDVVTFEGEPVAIDHDNYLGAVSDADGAHIGRHDPTRALREVAAKRAILAEHVMYRYLDSRDRHPALNGLGTVPCVDIYCAEHGYSEWTGPRFYCQTCVYIGQDGDYSDVGICPTLYALASVWSDHFDYDPSWALS